MSTNEDKTSIQVAAHDALFRAILKSLSPDQFSKVNECLSQLWVDVQIPKQASHIQPLLVQAMEASKLLIEAAQQDRDQ
ncbi:hypothetical protein [Erwinia billingiae]|uniref:hypothetical protein n=1 Tax=Erwinia billingiae TaxID=182337 RepID=UPI0022451BD8|nr:hypothetical protein [Erwinia billingiae]MCX0499726.1 hypothetical protein [Erwinia billingiae]